MSDLILADVSEFQGDIDWAAYGAASPAVIVRAHNGFRPDYKWARNADGAAASCRWWAAYQYLPASVDPVLAARRFAELLNGRSPNVVILDLEEGDGDQSARQAAWMDTMQWAAEWTYSGLYFARSRNLANVDWLAAYQSNEPTPAHRMWQFSDARSFPGIAQPCDASVFHGSVDELLGLAPVAPAPAPAPTPAPEAPRTNGDDDVPLLFWRNGNQYEDETVEIIAVFGAKVVSLGTGGAAKHRAQAIMNETGRTKLPEPEQDGLVAVLLAGLA